MSKLTKFLMISAVSTVAACGGSNDPEVTGDPITYEEAGEITAKIADSDVEGEDFIAVDPADITDKSASYSGFFALVTHVEEEST